jgi:disulfide bond formation protein DsbB
MTRDALLLFGTFVPVAAVGTALVTQHVFGMQPCPWCVLQRLIFLAIAAVSVLGLLWRGVLGARVAGVLALGLAGSGIAAALWQHFVAAESTSCDLTLADRIMAASGLDGRWPEVFGAFASCLEAKATLLGVPYEFYSLTLFVLLALAALRLIARPR